MKKLLIINSATFGRLTDSYMWCKYLKDEFDITFVSFDTLYPKAEMDGVNLKFVSYSGGKFIRELRFVLISLWYCLISKGPILVVYFFGAIWLKRVLFWKKMILDIRTFSVNRCPERRKKIDKNILETIRIYDDITIISDGLKSKIGFPKSNVMILPLGADSLSSVDSSFDQLKLLYVGILSGRDIGKTITGLKDFKDKFPDNNITYDIVGDGHYDELSELKQLSTSLGLDDTITFHGRLPYNELKPFFDKCNIGVSFVPKTDYYEFQPPTKTFEYIISGLYTIATSTHCNKTVINSDNGVLIEDNCNDFTKALESTWAKRESVNQKKIKESLVYYKWDNIVGNILRPILNKQYIEQERL